ncbi:MAG: NUDIX domain-containing protein, partial [Phaeodactylibacter sp.]|nr:NUDIX domain-containing protein [Phaeodactylibacter sp.]
PPFSRETLHIRYLGNPKLLLQAIDMLEKGRELLAVVIHYEDLNVLWSDFKALYKVLPAAGGLVFNPHQQLLLIFRRGFWDLPKGKLDPGETPAQAAVREVEEESGAQALKIQDFLTHTYHTYRDKKDRRILKDTYWYRMTAPDQDLTAQAEEDIENASWQDAKALLEQAPPIYRNIEDLLLRFGMPE